MSSKGEGYKKSLTNSKALLVIGYLINSCLSSN